MQTKTIIIGFVAAASMAACSHESPADYSKCSTPEIRSLYSNGANLRRGTAFSRVLSGREFRILNPDDKIAYLSTVPAADTGRALRNVLLAFDFHVPPKEFLRFRESGEVLYDGAACRRFETGPWTTKEGVLQFDLPDHVMESVSGRPGPIVIESISAHWWCNAHNGPQISIALQDRGAGQSRLGLSIEESRHSCFDDARTNSLP